MYNIISALLIALAIAGVGVYATLTYQQQVENEARFQCAQSSRYATTDEDGVEVWFPIQDLYQRCLEEKGIN